MIERDRQAEGEKRESKKIERKRERERKKEHSDLNDNEQLKPYYELIQSTLFYTFTQK